MKKKELAVGDSTEIELIHHASTRGKVRKSATVTTSDTTLGPIRISYSGEIGSFSDTSFLVTVDPPMLDFSSKDHKERTKLKAEIINISDKTLRLAVIDYPQNLCKIALRRKLVKPNQKTELMVKLNRRSKVNDFHKSITLELSDEDQTRFTIPIQKRTPKPQKKPTTSKKG